MLQGHHKKLSDDQDKVADIVYNLDQVSCSLGQLDMPEIK